MKQRLDVLVFEQAMAKSREHARALIMAGVVYVNECKVDKAGAQVDASAKITVREDPIPFVSRGGLKLQKALDTFPITLTDAVAADIGASTGGFTDCMLQHGARHVYALDVGYGQLDWKLRNDPRVTVMERTNARYMEPKWFDSVPLDFASIDVSFISLDKMLPPLLPCLKDGAAVVALIKPQFEAGREKVGKHGVVGDADVHRDVCTRILRFATDTGYTVRGLTSSPIRGPKGNIEFLTLLMKNPAEAQDVVADWTQCIADVVYAAHNSTII